MAVVLRHVLLTLPRALKVRVPRFLLISAMVLTMGASAWAISEPPSGSLRLALEPNMGHLATANGHGVWGVLGAASVAVALSDLIWLQARGNMGTLFGSKGSIATTVVDASLIYNIDIAGSTPFVELGAAIARLKQGQQAYGPQFIPVFGVGCDLKPMPHLAIGLGVRYHAIFDSALLENPAFITVGARFGYVFDPF